MAHWVKHPLGNITITAVVLAIVASCLTGCSSSPEKPSFRSVPSKAEWQRVKPVHLTHAILLSKVKPSAPAVIPDSPGRLMQSPALPPAAAVTEYEVTAYYLNVRDKPNRKAKIVNVVKKGEILRIDKKENNGWLQVSDGGYIHGGYARPVGASRMPASLQDAQPVRISWTKDIPRKLTEEIRSDSGLSTRHIAEILKGTDLENCDLEAAIEEIEDEYGINAFFTIAVMKLESGNGTSRLAKVKNNLFGLNAIDGDEYRKAYSFETKGDSVRKFGKLIADSYLKKGYTTVDKVAGKYCPANPKWSKLIQSIMKSDSKKSQLETY